MIDKIDNMVNWLQKYYLLVLHDFSPTLYSLKVCQGRKKQI